MKKFIIICLFCSCSFGVLPVIDVALGVALTALQAAFDSFSGSAKSHWRTDENNWAAEKKQWQSDNKFYDDARKKYEEILKAITEKKDSINALNEKEKQTYKLLENINEIAKKILNTRDFKALSDELKTDVIKDDYKIKYCENLKDEKAKYICYADFGSAAISLILQDKSANDMKKFNDAIGAIDTARKGSKDVKESADIANVIAQEHLELATYKAQKTLATKALKEKKILEMQAAKNRTLKDINKELDMSNIVKKSEK